MDKIRFILSARYHASFLCMLSSPVHRINQMTGNKNIVSSSLISFTYGKKIPTLTIGAFYLGTKNIHSKSTGKRECYQKLSNPRDIKAGNGLHSAWLGQELLLPACLLSLSTMPTLPVYLGVSWIQVKTPGLPYGSPNLPATTGSA